MSQHAISGGEWSAGLGRVGRESATPTDERSRLLELLDERLRFETMLSRLSADFIHLPAEEIDGQIERGLRQIVEFLDIERSCLTQFSEDGGELWVTHSYTIPGFAPFPHVDLAALLPWYTTQIRRGDVLRLARLPEEAPPEAVHEREQVAREGGPRSHLSIPFRVGESILGGIGFGSFRRELDWPDELVQSLQLVGEVFANALARRRAEEKASRLREQLAQVARVTLMGELAASIAHEVNQPLCAIVSNAQAAQRLLAGGFDAAEVGEALQDISQDGQRASAVIARIRGLLQKAPTTRAPVDLNEILREAAALMRVDLARRGIALRLELAEGLPAALGDRVQLQQVILNLMVNAAEAMGPAARGRRELVLRSTRDETGAVVAAVQDSGMGLDPRTAGRVFDAFFTTRPGSLGMGLAICKSIVEAHGGRIWASPNAAGGATFQFTAPGVGEGAP
jgi:signal transduction histidine kinase